jgi:hypothetical protein
VTTHNVIIICRFRVSFALVRDIIPHTSPYAHMPRGSGFTARNLIPVWIGDSYHGGRCAAGAGGSEAKRESIDPIIEPPV